MEICNARIMTEQITNQQDGGALIFLTCDNVEVMRFARNGDCYVKGNLVENDKEIIKELKQWLVYDQKDRIQSFARKVVEEIGKMEVIKDSPSTAYYEGKIDGRNHAIREAIKIVNSLSGLSGEVSQL